MGTKSNWYELSVKDPNIVNEDALLAKMRLLRQLGGVSNFNIDASILEFSQTTQKQLGIDHLKIKEKRLVNLFLTGVNAKLCISEILSIPVRSKLFSRHYGFII